MADDKYPDWLIRRVANAMLDTPSADLPGLLMFASDCPEDVAEARLLAAHVLDVLGYREVRSYPGYWAGPATAERTE